MNCLRYCFSACLAATLLPLTPHAAAHAQQLSVAVLPDSTGVRLAAFYNDPSTTRLAGDATIGPGTIVTGNMAALGGTLVISGRIEGDVVVINGSLEARTGAYVAGNVTVVGGDALIADDAMVQGAVIVYREPLRYRPEDDVIVYTGGVDERGISAGRDLPFGRTDLLIAAFGPYNRVEGLPIAVGPRIRFSGDYPLTARALLIARTTEASQLDPQRFGFDISVDQLVAPRAGLTVGTRLYSNVVPIEDWHLTDRESAIAAFVLHQDHRDHYEREGWAVFARMARPGTPLVLSVEYRDEEHETTPANEPFSLFDNGHEWRPEPSISDGALHSIMASLDYDTRNEKRDPSAGWLIRAQLEQGIGGTLVNQGPYEPEDLVLLREDETDFLSATVDVRRYARLTPYSRLGVRILAAGSLNARPLPPQRQHALGGEGSLPGYRQFEFDCGARARTVERNGATLYPYYGCDQVALVQLEYQAGFPFARRLGRALGVSRSLAHAARWVAFFDAGRAWNEPGSRAGRQGGNDDFSADAGVGLRLGPLGAYWAVPLSGQGHEFNFFLRLGPRL